MCWSAVCRPRKQTLTALAIDHLPSLRRDVLAHLTTGTFVAKAENVILLGPPGLGKTHLAIGLGVKAAHAGYSVLFDTANNWITRLADAHQAGRLEAELKKIRRYKLIIIDEVGYIPFDQDAANLFFQLIASRYEHGSVMVTSNLPFGRWGETFRRRRRRSHDRPPRPPRRSPHPHRRLLPHSPTPRAARQAEPRRPGLTNHTRGQDSENPDCSEFKIR
jgi:DNA replication protein DnaC